MFTLCQTSWVPGIHQLIQSSQLLCVICCGQLAQDHRYEAQRCQTTDPRCSLVIIIPPELLQIIFSTCKSVRVLEVAPRRRSGLGLRLRIEDTSSSPVPLSWWSPRVPAVACCDPTLCPVEGSIIFLCQVSIPEQHSTGLHLPSCCCSVAQSCPILCNRMDCSTPGFPVLHPLPELAQTRIH